MKIVFINLIFFVAQPLLAQTDTLRSIDELVNNFLENTNENVESSQIYSLFEYLIENPVDLNSPTVSDLLKIPFIDYPTAEKIVNYLNRHKEITSLSFLDTLSWLDSETAKNIKPFLSFNKHVLKIEREPENNFNIFFRSRIQTDLKPRKGFIENKFVGSRLKNYNRIKINYTNRYRFTFLTEKDAGEKSYMDFYTANLTVSNTGFIKKIILGDYLLEFGQGLVLWSPYAFSKSSDAVRTVTKRARTLTGYASSDENRFFRGFGTTLGYANLNLTLFYSTNKIDASLSSDSSSIKSVNFNGYHRTDSEILKKDIVSRKSYGAMLSFSPSMSLSFGYLFNHTEFSLPFSGSNTRGIQGSLFNFHSFTLDLYWKALTVSGELAYNQSVFAEILNVGLNFAKNFIAVFSFRNYPNKYYNLDANGFGELNNTKNETGFYTGISWKNRFGILNLYYDQFYFPSSTFSTHFPSSGNDFVLDFTSKKINSAIFRFRFKREEKPRIIQTKTGKGISNSARVEILLSGKKYSSRTRFEIKFYDVHPLPAQSGSLLFQEMNWNPFTNLKFSGRIVFFNTDSYETRLYEYEKNVRGIFYNPALFGKGIRWYLLAGYKIFGFVEFSLKYSETYKPFENRIGSGYSEIPGNLNNTLIFQIETIF